MTSPLDAVSGLMETVLPGTPTAATAAGEVTLRGGGCSCCCCQEALWPGPSSTAAVGDTDANADATNTGAPKGAETAAARAPAAAAATAARLDDG